MSATETRRAGGSFLIEEVPHDSITTPEDFSEETLLLGQTCRDFIEGEVLPVLDQLEAQEPGLMAKLLKSAGEIGLLAADIPEAFGGLGATKVMSMLVAESISGGGSFPVAHGAQTGIGTLPIVYFGTPEQKAAWLPGLATGEVLSAYALTEAGSGSDALAAKCTAKLEGDEWVLNGEKIYITNGSFADLFIVFAKIDGEKFTAFLVPRSAPGVSIGAEEKKMGIKGSSTTSVVLQDARIPKDYLLGEPGRGHVIAFNILNVGRFKLGAGTIGAAKVALKESLNYAAERHQFNRPLASFPLIMGKLGQMAARIFAGESAVYRTAGLMDEAIHGIPADEADRDKSIIKAIEEYSIECSIIKVYASEVLDYVVDETVQIFGGYGYVSDYPAERFYRDSRINRIFEGTNEINRMLIPGMLLKRALKGQLPLLAAAKGIQDELMALPDLSDNGDRPDFSLEMEQIAKAKKAVLLVAGVAAQTYGPKLQDEQEVLAFTADMIMETYAAESAILRAKKMLDAGKKIPVVRAIVSVVTYEAMERVGRAGREALAHVSEGDDLRMQLAGLKRFTRPEPIDVAAARRVVAQGLGELGSYKVPA